MLDELAVHFLIPNWVPIHAVEADVDWVEEQSEYLVVVRLGITLLPGGQMDGNSDKTASLHPTLPLHTLPCPMLYCLSVLPFCSSDETGLSKWAERNNTYFIREVGTIHGGYINLGREATPQLEWMRLYWDNGQIERGWLGTAIRGSGNGNEDKRMILRTENLWWCDVVDDGDNGREDRGEVRMNRDVTAFWNVDKPTLFSFVGKRTMLWTLQFYIVLWSD